MFDLWDTEVSKLVLDELEVALWEALHGHLHAIISQSNADQRTVAPVKCQGWTILSELMMIQQFLCAL